MSCQGLRLGCILANNNLGNLPRWGLGPMRQDERVLIRVGLLSRSLIELVWVSHVARVSVGFIASTGKSTLASLLCAGALGGGALCVGTVRFRFCRNHSGVTNFDSVAVLVSRAISFDWWIGPNGAILSTVKVVGGSGSCPIALRVARWVVLCGRNRDLWQISAGRWLIGPVAVLLLASTATAHNIAASGSLGCFLSPNNSYALCATLFRIILVTHHYPPGLLALSCILVLRVNPNHRSCSVTPRGVPLF